MYALATHLDMQTKLRAELFTIETDTPSMDELMALPYLDKIARETIRLYAAVPSTIRMATKDDVIPVNNPYTDKNGKSHRELRSVIRVVQSTKPLTSCWVIRVKKDDIIFMHILAINRSKEIWGPDAREFKFVTVQVC